MFLDKFCLGKVAKFGGQSLNGSEVIQLLNDCLGQNKECVDNFDRADQYSWFFLLSALGRLFSVGGP